MSYRIQARLLAMSVVNLVNLCLHAEDGIRDGHVTGVQTCALPIYILPVGQVGRPGLDAQAVENKAVQPLAVVEGRNLRSEERRVGKARRVSGARGGLKVHTDTVHHGAEDKTLIGRLNVLISRLHLL